MIFNLSLPTLEENVLEVSQFITFMHSQLASFPFGLVNYESAGYESPSSCLFWDLAWRFIKQAQSKNKRNDEWFSELRMKSVTTSNWTILSITFILFKSFSKIQFKVLPVMSTYSCLIWSSRTLSCIPSTFFHEYAIPNYWLDIRRGAHEAIYLEKSHQKNEAWFCWDFSKKLMK